jgi:subtilisin family serine protease
MKRRPIAVAIVLMALLAFASVLSFVFFSQPVPKNLATAATSATDDSSSSANPNTTSPTPGALRADQPPEFKPTAFVRDPSWRLLDWSVKPFPGKPGVEMRASSWAAPGKHAFIRVEEQVQRDASGKIRVLHIKEMVGDQIIVKLPEGSTQGNAEALATKIGAQAGSRPFAPDTWLFKLDQKLEAVPEGMENLKSTGAVIDYTEPDLIVRPARLPNDPKVTDFTTWHLYNNTQIDRDIKAARAWDRRTTAAYGTTNKVIVAVLDSGVRYSHQDLSANMWRNPGEIAGDGIDNDNNGWKDDIYGIDAADSTDWTDLDNDAKKDTLESPFGSLNLDSDPMDTDGHGTHCAGLIGAVGNNGIGLAGVAWTGVEIMALRFIDGTGSVSDEVLCMDYARLRGAKVINASFGQDGGESSTERNAINRLNSSGVILVAAAGNGGSDYVGDDNNGSAPFYPASYTNGNIIAVGATDQNDNKAGFSNFGATTVDLFAPGDNMYSTRTGSDTSYSSGSGTSFAAPVVSGALALLIAEYPSDTVAQRVARVINTNAVDVIPGLSGQCVTGGRLNLSKLLPAADIGSLTPALVWHRPDHLEGLIPSRMRTPSSISLFIDVTVYSGLKKFNNTNGVNSNGLVNQSGGWLFYRTSPAVAWTSNALVWHTNNGDYQFWKATIPSVPARTFQYYLQLDFESGARTTYSYYTNNPDGFATTTNLVTAQASPYTFTVAKASATITLSNLNPTYNGSAHSITASTTPSGLTTLITYNGNSSGPTNAGTYPIVATINDSNYEGSATDTMTISKASTSISTPPSASPIRAGQSLASSFLSGGTASVAGTFAFISPGAVPELGTSPQAVTFTPADFANYLTASTFASVTAGGVENPNGDADGDGVPNLLEHALAEFPSPSTGPGSTTQITTQSVEAGGQSNTTVTLTALVRTNDPNLVFTPEATLGLGSSSSWTSSGFTLNTNNQTNVPAGFQRREYQFNAGTNTRAFLKLTIQQQ